MASAACAASSKPRARSCALTLGHEPSLADLAAAIGSDEKRLGKTIVRINTIESTSPLSCGENVDEAQLPAVLVPAEPERPDHAYERSEVRESRARRHRDAAGARAPRDLPLLLRRSHDEGDRCGARRERIARVATARARAAPAARGAGRRHGAGGCRSNAPHRDPRVRRQAEDGQGRPLRRRRAYRPESDTQVAASAQRAPWSSTTRARRARRAASRRAETAWRASGSRFLRGTVRRRCPRPRR